MDHTNIRNHDDPARLRDHDAGLLTPSAIRDDRSLLAAAQWGDTAAAGRICAHHGTALISVAWTLLGDRQHAESVVVEVIADACARPGAATADTTADTTVDTTVDTSVDASVRHELARLTYQACLRSPPATCHLPPATCHLPPATDGRRLPDRRAVLALILLGDHTCLDVADLIGLPVDTVADLVHSFLRDIRRDAHSDPRRHAGRRFTYRTHREPDR